METLTQSLTKQLGFDLSQTAQAVEEERRMKIGSSFVEPIKEFQFGKRENLSGKKTKMSASILIPGARKPQ